MAPRTSFNRESLRAARHLRAGGRDNGGLLRRIGRRQVIHLERWNLRQIAYDFLGMLAIFDSS